MPPKRSRGKPALSRVPFLEGVNGDSDYGSSGENGSQELSFTGHLCRVLQHRRADILPEPGEAVLSACWKPVLQELPRLRRQDADLCCVLTCFF